LTRDACHSDGGHVLVSIERAVAQIVDLISPAVRALSSGSKLYTNVWHMGIINGLFSIVRLKGALEAKI